MRRRLGYSAAALIAVLALGACSHEGGSSSGSASRDLAPNAAAAPAKVAGAEAAGGATGSTPATLLGDTGVKIRTAELTVDIRGAANVAARADEAEDITARAGGEVDSDDRTTGTYANATLQLRVPPETLSTTLRALSKLGTEKSRQLSTTDVTEKVADVSSRVASAREAIVTLRTLYSRATKVADVIAVESELASREASLESLEAQQRSLARQTALASITLTLAPAPRAKAVVAPAKKHRGGFLGGLGRGWDGFTATAAWLATALGTLLPFLLLLVVLGLAGRFAWTRRTTS
jgi:hypothetical protein